MNTRTLIRGVRVFDGVTTTPRTDVLIDGERIAAPDGQPVDHEVDGTGKTLLPGLIDAHTHVADGDLAKALRYGVTTELDMFCLPGNLARQRELAAQRDDVADIRSAGMLATAPGGHPSQLITPETMAVMGDAAGSFDTVANAAQAKAFVEARVAEGVDYLKIVIDDAHRTMPTLEPATVRALVDAAHDAGLKTIGHISTAHDVTIALDAGIDGLAHAFSDIAPGDDTAAEIAAKILAHNVFVVTTLAYIEIGGASTGPLANGSHAVRALHEAGVTLLAGTDATPFAPVHGEAMHRELELLVEAGLTPRAALTAATSTTAAQFGLDDRGRIAPGLRADLVLVDGDPTVHISATAKIAGVWRRGARLTELP